MTQKYEMESWLRPQFEWYAAFTYFGLAFVLLAIFELVALLPSMAFTVAGIMVVRGGFRFHQGLSIYKYKNSLKKLPLYKISSTQIKPSAKEQILGKGFQWTSIHSQRVLEIEHVDNRKYLKDSRWYKACRAVERKIEHIKALNWLYLELSEAGHLPFLRRRFDLGGFAYLHAVGYVDGEEHIYCPQSERYGHTLVLGTTRVGKTRAMEFYITQDIKRGDVVFVIDPKGDADLFLRTYTEALKAGRPFYCFNMGSPETSDAYNAIGNFSKITEVASRIASNLKQEGEGRIFKDFTWRHVNIVQQALFALGETVTFEKIKEHGQNVDQLAVRYLRQYLEVNGKKDWKQKLEFYMFELEQPAKDRSIKFHGPRGLKEKSLEIQALYQYYTEENIYDDIGSSLLKTLEMDRNYLDKLVGSLLPLMEKLCTGDVAKILSPDYNDMSNDKKIFTFEDVIREGGVCYIGLDALTDPEVAEVVGGAMLADLSALSGKLYKEGFDSGSPDSKRKLKNVCIHADEVNELISDAFIPMVNKAGGSKFMVTAYTQAISDIDAKLGNQAKTGQILGNFNNLIMLRVKNRETAEYLTDKLKKVSLKTKMTESGAQDSSNPDTEVDFVSTTRQRTTNSAPQDMIQPADLENLPKGQAFAVINGGQLYKLRIPLADDQDFKGIPGNIVDCYELMKEKYTSSNSEEWYKFESSFDLDQYKDDVLNVEPEELSA